MRIPKVDDFVRLRQDVPQWALSRGEVGVVRSTWFSPNKAYEVEFHVIGAEQRTRVLLPEDQLEVEDGSLLGEEAEERVATV